jgi:hypothetical protein
MPTSRTRKRSRGRALTVVLDESYGQLAAELHAERRARRSLTWTVYLVLAVAVVALCVAFAGDDA